MNNVVPQSELDVVDAGRVTAPAPVGTNILNDNTKNWMPDVHRNKQVSIVIGAGAGQFAHIASNTENSLIIRGTWTVALDTTSHYVILGLNLAQIIRDVLGGGVDVDLPAEFAAIIAAIGTAAAAVDIIDRWNRQLGKIDVERVLGAALAHANPLIARLTDGVAFVDPRDVSDRQARLLGIIYGSQGQIQQRAATLDLLIQLRHAGVEIDPRAIRALTAADIITVQSLTQWGGVALTGRDISLDLAKLDVNLSTRASEATLATQLNITLSSLRDAIRGAGTKDLSTLETDIESILARLDVALSTRATEATLAKLIPIAKAAVYNTALPAAEANWLGSDITPTNSPSYIRVYVCVSVAGILRVARTIGGTTLTEDLNGGSNLTANAAYMFTVPWRTGDGVNIRYSVTTGTIKRLLIDEIGGAE